MHLSTISRHRDGHLPSVTFVDGGEAVVWTLSTNEFSQGADNIGKDIGNEHSESSVERIGAKSFRRPIRALSHKVNSALSKFPTVSMSDRRVHAHRVRKDIRESTPCSLEEWESLVQHVTSRLKLPVQHEPAFCQGGAGRTSEESQ